MNQKEIKEILYSFPPSWEPLLSQEKKEDYFQCLVNQVSKEYENENIYPPLPQVYQTLKETPLEKVKVVIIGQDPYFHQGQANGLAFSVNKGIQLPPSLVNIYKELHIEFGYDIPLSNGDLSPWAKQGVLLLNSTLTVKDGYPESHSKYGWETFTDHLIKKLDQQDRCIVYLLWGNHAKKKASIIHNPKAKIVSCPHPSPLSASRGFFHSDCFKKVNERLKEASLEEIDFHIVDDI
ncbi:MAG: uracil-DNA glycosylase [Bacilli bacterium]|nr:uracil-DNA glycosylase [Bacilli bacterium]